MGQTDFKYVIGYSSVSHMGYVVMGLATLDPVGINGAALQMFSHGVMTALMFSMVGAVYDQAHTREIAAFGGLASKMPRFAIFFLIAGVTSVGLPGFSGFIAEFHIFVGTFNAYPLLGAPGRPRRRYHGRVHLPAAGAGVLRSRSTRSAGAA